MLKSAASTIGEKFLNELASLELAQAALCKVSYTAQLRQLSLIG